MSDPCTWPISCTYECTPRFEDDPLCPYWVSTVGGRQYSFPIYSQTTIDLWGNSVDLFKVDRLLEYGYTINTVSGGACGSATRQGTSSISESCVYTETEFHYINQTDKIALFTTKTITYSFSNTSNEFAALAVGSAPVWFLKLPMGAITVKQSHQVIFLKDQQKFIQDEYISDSTSDSKTFFLLPTPDPRFAGGIPMDDEIKRYGFYNQYESCYDAGPESKTALDGGRDMFFPAWLRAFVKDRNVIAHRNKRFIICQSNKFDPINETTNWSPSILSPIPCGSYVKHPEWGEMYNFFVPAVSHGGMLNIKSDNLDTKIVDAANAYNPVGGDYTIREQTLYYPISLV